MISHKYLESVSLTHNEWICIWQIKSKIVMILFFIDVTENDVWSHFEDCGEIENVRIIRDNKTGTGKGIGYVQFQVSEIIK